MTQYLTLSEVALDIKGLLQELIDLHGKLKRPNEEVWRELSDHERRDCAIQMEDHCDRIHDVERRLNELNRLHCDSKINFNFEALWG